MKKKFIIAAMIYVTAFAVTILTGPKHLIQKSSCTMNSGSNTMKIEGLVSKDYGLFSKQYTFAHIAEPPIEYDGDIILEQGWNAETYKLSLSWGKIAGYFVGALLMVYLISGFLPKDKR